MSASTAIGLVSSSLRALLVGEMQLSLAVDVTLLAPDEVSGDRRVNLFLYRVERNPFLRNQEPVPNAKNPRLLVPPPLPLDLYYLLTCYAPNDVQDGNVTAQQLLGEAMRVLHEHPVLPTAYLAAGLQDASEKLQITLCTLDPEELSRIWTTFAQPFRLSVLYQVSVVQLDLLRTPAAVAQRVRTVGVPQARRAGRPVVFTATPTSLPVGAELTLTGQRLAGWRATVSIGGRVVLDHVELAADSIVVTVPADLVPGLHEAAVDVAGLCRTAFTVEVTA